MTRNRHLFKLFVAVAAIALVAVGAAALRTKTEERGPPEAPAPEALHDSARISKQAAEAAGVKTAIAGDATIHDTVTLTGRITLNQNTLAQVKARFPGIVREVRKGQGETVAAGETLALIESNDSLQVYPVKAPLDGIILSRNTNVGDVAGEAPLFTVANVSDVWAEFHVFPRDSDRIRSGQKVRVSAFEGTRAGEAPIAVVLPLAESASQTIVARVTLANPDGLWRSGMTVRGDVQLAEKTASIAVKTAAIQRMEGKSVVFVQTGEDLYAQRAVKTGMADADWTEIVDGLKAGENYVSDNSFLIKADIGKAGAEHEE
jgi:cobalt-zinc-cadmium efflux system membrane fusion protein